MKGTFLGPLERKSTLCPALLALLSLYPLLSPLQLHQRRISGCLLFQIKGVMLSLSLNVLHLLVRVLHIVISKRSHQSLLQVQNLFLIYQLLHLLSLLLLFQSLPQLLVCPPRPLECLDALAAFGRPLATGGSSNSPTWLPETQMMTTRLLSVLTLTSVKLSLLGLSLRPILALIDWLCNPLTGNTGQMPVTLRSSISRLTGLGNSLNCLLVRR
jgi:hypothetical protein